MMRSSNTIIVLLDRQKISIVASHLAAPITLDIPPGIFVDLDVTDEETFQNLLCNWLNQNKITPCSVVVVLSTSVYFQKSISPTNDSTQKKNQIDDFLQTIPFKNLLSKDYSIGATYQLITVNKDFYEPLVKYFEINHFNVIALLPLSILDAFKLPLATLSPKEAKSIITNLKILLPYSMISAQEIDKNYSQKMHYQAENKPRMIALISIFSLLFVVLLGFIFIRPALLQKEYQKKLKTNSVAIPTPKLQEIPTISAPVITPTINYLSQEEIKIKIVNASGIPNQAAKIKQTLIGLGFKNIITDTSPKITGTKNQLIYTSNVSFDNIQIITNTIKTELGDISQKQAEEDSNQNIVVTIVAEIK